MKFGLDYYETYHRIYTVEADSKEEAREKLEEMLMDGKEDGPDQCAESGFWGVWKEGE